ncbi:unnamed protein product [Clonostachys byssicola]|uniref:Zn(2)-C6 fungal-type domain-containing protein n=1 Tax=Clonostachys byssicola TaxID=160290 RepID=A0A9N9ULG6_9HYPO|nr:unnamed protein product [Clonostachys byssicola]
MSPERQVRGRRSAGCATCRKRKVKCDEKRPVCDRCRRGFHVCLGYDTIPIFVFEDKRLGKPVPSSQTFQSERSLTASCMAEDNRAIQKHPGLLASEIPASLNLSAFSQDIVLSYMISTLSDTFLQGSTAPEIHGVNEDAPSFLTVLSSKNRDSPAFICGLSSAEALFGHMHGDKCMVRHSSSLYDQALRRFQRDLEMLGSHGGWAQHYVAIWSCLFLVLYELLSGMGPINWVHHSLGIAALAQSAGPAAFQSPMARELLLVLRSFIVVADVARRKRSFLDQDEWKTIPWQVEPDTKTIGDKLQDLFCQIPGILEDSDEVLECPSKIRLAALQEKVSLALNELFRLQVQWMQETQHGYWEIPAKKTNSVWASEDNEPLFGRVLWFGSFRLALDYIYFFVVWLLLHGVCNSASLDEPTNPPKNLLHGVTSSLSMVRLGDATPQEHAVEVCRAVDFLLLGEDGHRGPMSLLFPMKIASRYLEDLPEIFQCLKRTLHRISADKGFGLGDQVLNMERTDFCFNSGKQT